jgi:hypothetical protein
MTPLEVAAVKGKTEVVDHLLKAGASLSVESSQTDILSLNLHKQHSLILQKCFIENSIFMTTQKIFFRHKF